MYNNKKNPKTRNVNTVLIKISRGIIDVNHLSNCRKQTVQYLANLKPSTLGFREISKSSECILTL